MKAISSPQFSTFAARTLKLVGAILILSFLLDFVILSFPFRTQDKGWQMSLAAQLIDRGIIPMVGLALLFAGYWIDNLTSDLPNSRKPWLNLTFWALLLSSLLGLLFLLLFPFHFSNVLQGRAQAIERINQEADQATTQLQSQLGSPQAQAQIESQKNQLKSQISQLLQNEQQLNQALGSEQVPEQFKNLLRQAKANPQALDQLLQQQFNAEALRNQGLTQIQRRKQEVEQQAQQEVKSGLRISFTSLLLSIGYIAIGWTGLRSIGAAPPDRRRSSVTD